MNSNSSCLGTPFTQGQTEATHGETGGSFQRLVGGKLAKLTAHDCQFITRTSRNDSGLHETEAAPRAEDACRAASKLAQERCLPEHWASNSSCDCIDTLTPIGMLHSEISSLMRLKRVCPQAHRVTHAYSAVPVEATDDVEMPTRVKRAKVLVSVTNEMKKQ